MDENKEDIEDIEDIEQIYKLESESIIIKNPKLKRLQQ